MVELAFAAALVTMGVGVDEHSDAALIVKVKRLDCGMTVAGPLTTSIKAVVQLDVSVERSGRTVANRLITETEEFEYSKTVGDYFAGLWLEGRGHGAREAEKALGSAIGYAVEEALLDSRLAMAMDPWAEEDSAPNANRDSPYRRRIGIVIGITEYREMPALEGAAADAREVAGTLRRLGFDEVVERYDRDATRSAILATLGSTLRTISGAGDLVVVYFGGLAVTEARGGDSPWTFLIPFDGDVRSAYSTGIPLQDLRELRRRTGVRHVYLVMAAPIPPGAYLRGLGAFPAASDYVRMATSIDTVEMIAAAQPEQRLHRAADRDVFTGFWLQAIQGAADSNRDGVATGSEVGRWVSQRVTAVTGSRQSPHHGLLEGAGEVVFALGAR
jgi:hypothetical protein